MSYQIFELAPRAMIPTKPGWYWYRDGDDIECVRCIFGPDNGSHADHSKELYIMYAGVDRESMFDEPHRLPGEWLGEAIPPTEHDDWCDRTCDCGAAERKPKSAP